MKVKVAIKGWVEDADLTVIELAKRYERYWSLRNYLH